MKMLLLRWLSILIIPLPSAIKIPLYRILFGYQIADRVKIGWSWIWVGAFTVGEGVRIGHFNRFKNIPNVHIGERTSIGTGNTFTSTAEFTDPRGMAVRGNEPRLEIGRHCGITISHYFDVQDVLSIGDFTVIAGIESVFFTHFIDVTRSEQSTKPIRIGMYCMVGSNAKFSPGAQLGDCCIVNMGSVFTKQQAESFVQYGGNPASPHRKLSEEAAFFHRKTGWIGTYATAPDARNTEPEI